MTDADARRGAVIGAALQFMTLLEHYQGNTADWPIRIICDDPKIAAEFELSRGVLIEALNNLKPCERNASSTRT